MRVSQAHPGLISLDRRVRPPNPLLGCDNNADGPVLNQVSYARHAGCDPRIRYLNSVFTVEYANRKSDLVESTVLIERWDFAGSTPVSTTSTET
jgi:hypothetical protein